MLHLPLSGSSAALLRRLVMLSWCLLAAGCSSLAGKGYLFTRDGQPLQLSEEVTLTQGHKRLEFNPQPWLASRLRLHDAQSELSLWTTRGDYAGNSLFIDSQDSGLDYDIQARWREQQAETIEREESESCSAPGYCSKPVRRLDCGRRTYREGTERYEDLEDDERCEEETAVERDHFDDCPGHRTARKRYRVYKLLVSLEFREPFSDSPPVAEFSGESHYRQHAGETLAEGRCEVY
ncbi:hypothetical protein [Pseudomonas sp. Gutcm_11s]|uniref:hypothetical protein n=1 Tax=Pseudomonas sp. Gutcm_11s TaxID=3026088 RepID=UPI00235E7547|nr:hypothetical protein [Pseudomonas sp. Gutcm_11s]MDD0842450.1 hypothetical protein [Pseudomonas sp. Gutcm_11s]